MTHRIVQGFLEDQEDCSPMVGREAYRLNALLQVTRELDPCCTAKLSCMALEVVEYLGQLIAARVNGPHDETDTFHDLPGDIPDAVQKHPYLFRCVLQFTLDYVRIQCYA
jgi:hypothetical protein